MNLYNLSSDYQRLLDKDEYDAAELDALEHLQDNIEDKAVAISKHILNMQAEYAAVVHRQKEMFERASALSAKMDSLKEYLRDTLQKCHIDKITKSPDFVISIKTNPPSIHIDDEDKLPKNFFKVKETISIDKTSIKEAIDNGEVVPGASVIRRTRLEIK